MTVKSVKTGNSTSLAAGNSSVAKPEAPTIGAATATGSTTATVAYTAATKGAAGTTFTATSTPSSITGTGASPITVSGLTGSTSYTFTVKATNANGDSPQSSASNSITTSAAVRGLFAGGVTTPEAMVNVIDYITIASTGNATDFGDLTVSRRGAGGCSSSTRGVFGGGDNLDNYALGLNVIDYVTIATTGNATDFGDLTVARWGVAGAASSTRGCFSSGRLNAAGTKSNVIDYITIASTGNAIDFGDSTVTKFTGSGFSSPTRGVFAAGWVDSPINVIDYITIASTGNATDFGDLTAARSDTNSGAASSTRGVVAGGYSDSNVIDYVTIATTGNATDFGDLSANRSGVAAVTDTSRVVFGGGSTGGVVNVMEYITITSTGNTTDFGDLTILRVDSVGVSNGHGGL
jgi:hypothetical protein